MSSLQRLRREILLKIRNTENSVIDRVKRRWKVSEGSEGTTNEKEERLTHVVEGSPSFLVPGREDRYEKR